jgi:hypothetical protein
MTCNADEHTPEHAPDHPRPASEQKQCDTNRKLLEHPSALQELIEPISRDLCLDAKLRRFVE